MGRLGAAERTFRNFRILNAGRGPETQRLRTDRRHGAGRARHSAAGAGGGSALRHRRLVEPFSRTGSGPDPGRLPLALGPRVFRCLQTQPLHRRGFGSAGADDRHPGSDPAQPGHPCPRLLPGSADVALGGSHHRRGSRVSLAGQHQLRAVQPVGTRTRLAGGAHPVSGISGPGSAQRDRRPRLEGSSAGLRHHPVRAPIAPARIDGSGPGGRRRADGSVHPCDSPPSQALHRLGGGALGDLQFLPLRHHLSADRRRPRRRDHDPPVAPLLPGVQGPGHGSGSGSGSLDFCIRSAGVGRAGLEFVRPGGQET